MVHRDLKPENVVLGGFGEVIVLDWGLATLVDQAEEPGETEAETMRGISISEEALTDKTQGLLGTPCYMAPEQVDCRNELVDSRTDIYALGGILFEILTSRPPVEGTTTAEVFERIKAGNVPRARQLNPTVPRALEAICARALAKDRAKRYSKATDMADDVRRWIADEPVTAYPDPLAARARRWRRRHRTQTRAVVVLVALGAFGVAYRREAVYSDRLAVINHSVDEANIRLTQDKTEFRCRGTGSSTTSGKLPAEEREALAIEEVKKFRDAVVNNPVLKCHPELESLRKTLLKEPLDFFRKFRGQLKADSGTGPTAIHRLALANHALAFTTAEIGSVPDAIQSYSEAIALLDPLARENPSVTDYQYALAHSHNNIGLLLMATGRPDDALQACNAALKIQERLALANPSVTEYQDHLAKCHNNIGSLLIATGRDEDALKAYNAALKIWERLARESPSVTDYQNALASSHNNIGAVLSATGRPDDALQAYNAALKIQERLALANPSVTEYQKNNLAISHNNIGLLLMATGRPDERAEGLQRVAEDPRAAGASANPSVTEYQNNLAISHNNIGLLLMATGRPDDARKSYDEALKIQERLARDHPGVHKYQGLMGAILNNLAFLEMSRQAWTEARGYLQRAIVYQRTALTVMPRNPEYRQIFTAQLRNLTKVEQAMGNAEAAVRAAREVGEMVRGNPIGTYNIACALALCIPIARPGERAELAEEALKTLLRRSGRRLERARSRCPRPGPGPASGTTRLRAIAGRDVRPDLPDRPVRQAVMGSVQCCAQPRRRPRHNVRPIVLIQRARRAFSSCRKEVVAGQAIH